MTTEQRGALDYVRQRQASMAASPFAAMVSAVLDAMGPDAPGDLCLTAGQRWYSVSGIEFLPDANFAQISEAINASLMRQDWGWCEFEQSHRELVVRHHHAPLLEVFGPERLYHGAQWVQGFYEQLFVELWPDQALALALDEAQSDELVLCFCVTAA